MSLLIYFAFKTTRGLSLCCLINGDNLGVIPSSGGFKKIAGKKELISFYSDRSRNQSVFYSSDWWKESFISAVLCHCSGRLQKGRYTSGIMSTFSALSRRTLTRSFQLCLGACTGSLRNTGTRKYLLFQSFCLISLLNSIEFMFSTQSV